MSDQRLSKLQSWIINRAIENFNRDIEKWGKSNLNFKRPFIYRTDIYIDYFKCKDFKNIPQKLRVSTSRSLNRLEERGLIEFALYCRKGMAFFTEKFYIAIVKESEEGS